MTISLPWQLKPQHAMTGNVGIIDANGTTVAIVLCAEGGNGAAASRAQAQAHAGFIVKATTLHKELGEALHLLMCRLDEYQNGRAMSVQPQERMAADHAAMRWAKHVTFKLNQKGSA